MTQPNNRATGLDVSYYQPNVNWAEVAKHQDFAICRATYGMTRDKSFASHWAGIGATNMVRGAYLFYRPSQDAKAQADFFCDTIGPYATGDLPAIVDIENNKYDQPITFDLRQKIQVLIDTIEARMKIRPMIYTGPSVWRDAKLPNYGCKLFIANYGVSVPAVPAAWAVEGQSWTFWQWTDRAVIPGTNAPSGVDGDYYNGTPEQLGAWLASLAPDLPPPPDPQEGLKATIRLEVDKLVAQASHVKGLVDSLK